jgi:hypothetical protein
MFQLLTHTKLSTYNFFSNKLISKTSVLWRQDTHPNGLMLNVTTPIHKPGNAEERDEGFEQLISLILTIQLSYQC